jgi:hypothetical protein
MSALVYGANGNAPKLWIAGFNASPFLRSWSGPNVSLEQQENTNAASGGGKEYLPGLESVSFKADGNLSIEGGTALDHPDEFLNARFGGVDAPISISPITGAEGDLAFTFLAGVFEYGFGAAVGQVAPFDCSAMSTSGVLVRGVVLRGASISGSGTATTTGVQAGAIPAGKVGYVGVHVGTCTGTSPSTTVTVQSASSNLFSSPTARISLTAQGNQSFRWGSVAGAVTDTWWRISTVTTGTTPVLPIFIVFGIR